MTSLTSAQNAVISAKNVSKHFVLRQGPIGFRKEIRIRAVDGVSFSVERGSCFAIVGESGSGKSTLARLIVGLLKTTEGEISVSGEDIPNLTPAELRHLRRKVQLVLQDPHASLDPRMTVGQILHEALIVHNLRPGKQAREARVLEVLRHVGLSASHLDRFPNALSGGQRQRVAIARAIICEPEVLVLDEPVSALDVSIQAQIINLLLELQKKLNLTYLIITHDLSLVRYMADNVGVMYLGKFVETGPTSVVCNSPVHPYSECLLSAVAGLDPELEKSRPVRILQGTVPSPAAPPGGCTFHTRCPHARAIAAALPDGETVIAGGDRLPRACVEQKPDLKGYSDNQVQASCHFGASLTRAGQ